MGFLNEHGFSVETEKFLLENELGYRDVAILGVGTQSHIFKVTKDTASWALKIKFNDGQERRVEAELDRHRPEYLKSKQTVADIFRENCAEIKQLEDKYYKYMIVYKNDLIIPDDLIKKLFNKEFELNGLDLTFDEIHGKVQELSSCGNTVQEIGSKLERTVTRGRFKQWLLGDKKICDSDANAIIALLRHFGGGAEMCIFTALLADEDLSKYISRLKGIGIMQILDQLYKIAKHTLKALESLHSKALAHRDIHAGNITVTSVARGKTYKNEYQLIDFGVGIDATDEEALKEAQKDDVRRIGYSLLIPIFWNLFKNDDSYYPDNPGVNNGSIGEISEQLNEVCKEDGNLRGKVENFVTFLRILAEGRFANAKTARERLTTLDFSDGTL